MPPTKTWKSVEGEIAKYFNGKRRGADYINRDSRSGKTDVVVPGWAVEIKHTKSPTYGLIVAALEQATRDKEHEDDIVVAVIHRLRQEYGDSLACMFLQDFKDAFGYPSGNNWRVANYTAKKVIYNMIERSVPANVHNRISVLIVTKHGQRSIVVMRLSDFADRFINITPSL